jgi:hypothetical protein
MAHRFGLPIRSISIAVAVVMLLHSVAEAAERDDQPPACAAVAKELQRYIDSMLAASATFRAQCQRIAGARALVVLIRIDPRLAERSYRARTSFGRTPGGALVARVHISLRTNPVQWIAHEIEHVLEQLDGLSLPALAAARQGAWLSTEKMFETTRAIEAGRRVAGEIRQSDRRPRREDSFVE